MITAIHTKTVNTIAAITNSNTLAGLPPSGSFNAKNTRTSEAVMSTPAHSGNEGKSRHRAIPEPRSSARSVATMASSART